MEIREEYKQLKDELKRNNDRSRKLDLLSVGIFKEAKKSSIAIEAYVYNETGLKLSDSADNIFSLFKEIRELEHIEEDITDFSKDWDGDKYKSFENDIDEINYFIFRNLDFIIEFFNDEEKIEENKIEENTTKDEILDENKDDEKKNEGEQKKEEKQSQEKNKEEQNIGGAMEKTENISKNKDEKLTEQQIMEKEAKEIKKSISFIKPISRKN